MTRNRRMPDYYADRAKREGLAARSIYKLEEIDKRWGLLRRGARVLDLGCAPGSWMQYAAERVGREGVVIGFDLKPIDISLPPQATAHVGDIYKLDFSNQSFDVVLSDMAPSTMGDHKIDALRSAALAESALAWAERLLCIGGHVVVKVLEGGDVPAMVNQMRAQYRKVELLRPQATRKASTEIFLVGLGREKKEDTPS